MKKTSLLAAICVFGISSAYADIPRPPVPDVQETEITGTDAFDLGTSLTGDLVDEPIVRVGWKKVYYSSSGTMQIVCGSAFTEREIIKKNPQYAHCTVSQSRTGKPIEKHRHRGNPAG